MQIIIEIPEDEYKLIMEYYGGYPGGCFCVLDAVKDGTPLPKGHGRLIDADAYKKQNDDILDCEIDHPKYQDTLRELIDNAPTIIEADKEETQ